MTRKLYVKSYGCQMNVYDSNRMADMLAPEGFVETATPDDADLIILNTCHIREKAAEKVYSELGRMRVLKNDAAREGRRVTVAVAGCVAQAEGAEIIRRAPDVDLVVGPQSYHRLPDMLARAEHGKVLDTEFPVEGKFDHLAAPSRAAIRKRGVSAFITVQEGCDRILEAMNRRHTRADYLRSIERLRNARPDMAFSSDFIVGFPGETESDFQDTIRLLAEVGFASAYSFKYSPRPGTPAADMEQLPEAVKHERLQRLQNAIDRQQAAF